MTTRAKQIARDEVRTAPAGRTVKAVEDIRRRLEATPGTGVAGERRRGRGATFNPDARYEPHRREDFDDGWNLLDEPPPLNTEVTIEKPRVIITKNDSPDISFDRSINPYRGCEHGCV